MSQIIIFSLIIVTISVALLSVKVLFKKNGEFSSQHVSDNPALRKQGIHCVLKQDKEARMKSNIKNNK